LRRAGREGFACCLCISAQIGNQESTVIDILLELRGIRDLAVFLGFEGFKLALQLLVFVLLDAELSVEEGWLPGRRH
jgi:hypothetical protein